MSNYETDTEDLVQQLQRELAHEKGLRMALETERDAAKQVLKRAEKGWDDCIKAHERMEQRARAAEDGLLRAEERVREVVAERNSIAFHRDHLGQKVRDLTSQRDAAVADNAATRMVLDEACWEIDMDRRVGHESCSLCEGTRPVHREECAVAKTLKPGSGAALLERLRRAEAVVEAYREARGHMHSDTCQINDEDWADECNCVSEPVETALAAYDEVAK